MAALVGGLCLVALCWSVPVVLDIRAGRGCALPAFEFEVVEARQIGFGWFPLRVRCRYTADGVPSTVPGSYLRNGERVVDHDGSDVEWGLIATLMLVATFAYLMIGTTTAPGQTRSPGADADGDRVRS